MQTFFAGHSQSRCLNGTATSSIELNNLRTAVKKQEQPRCGNQGKALSPSAYVLLVEVNELLKLK
jgi:hypothetical protein